jgi:hypothetical protein
MSVGISEGEHRLTKNGHSFAGTVPAKERQPQVPGQKRHYLGTGMQDGTSAVDPVQAGDVEHHMPIEDVVHHQDPRHDYHPPQLLVDMMPSPPPIRLPNHAPRRSEAGSHWCCSRTWCSEMGEGCLVIGAIDETG